MNIVIITGQTATGKTELALKLAAKLNGELINCDSRQIYKYLDIISGKDLTDKIFHEVEKQPSRSIGYYLMQDTRVWLYDIVKPNMRFSSYEFTECALPVLKNILSQGKTPIVVGGTYFYLYHLLYGIDTENIQPDNKLREELDQKTLEELRKMLKKLDEQTFDSLNNSDRNNPRRLIRKIEVLANSKKSLNNSFLNKQEITLNEKLKMPVEIEYFGLRYRNRETELKSIKDRVEKRFREGAVDEVKSILQLGYNEDDPGLKTIGYQQLIRYMKGETPLEQATQEWITKEIQYAKRQYTFMKRDKNIVWREA